MHARVLKVCFYKYSGLVTKGLKLHLLQYFHEMFCAVENFRRFQRAILLVARYVKELYEDHGYGFSYQLQAVRTFYAHF